MRESCERSHRESEGYELTVNVVVLQPFYFKSSALATMSSLFVGNLPHGCSRKQVADAFAAAGFGGLLEVRLQHRGTHVDNLDRPLANDIGDDGCEIDDSHFPC